MSHFRFRTGDTVALIACSDGMAPELRARIDELCSHLRGFGLQVEESRTLMRAVGSLSGTPRERSDELNRLFADPKIAAIFDLSGGDSANQILPLLDYAAIRSADKPLFGLSDLCAVLNAISARSGIRTYHYRILNLAGAYGERQREEFYRTFFEGLPDLYNFDFEFLRGEDLNGDVIGGNLRCLLKLAGTPYWPDASGKVLLLESLRRRREPYSVHVGPIVADPARWKRCSGLLLGTFTELERRGEFDPVREYLLDLTESRGIPIVRSNRIGHGEDAKCVVLG